VTLTNLAPVAVTFDYRPVEQFRVQRAVMRRWTWYLFYALTVGLPLLLIGLNVLGNLLLPIPPMPFSDFGLLFAFPAIALVLLPLTQLYSAYAHKRVHTIPHAEHTIGLSDAGLEVACVVAKVAVPWLAIYKVVETSRFFLFYINKRCAYYIPKRAVGDPAQVALIKDWIRDRAGPKAKLLPAAA